MAIGNPLPADSGGTQGGVTFSCGITSNWNAYLGATGLTTADTLTNFDPDVDLTRSVTHDMTFNGNEGTMIQTAIEYPSTMTASTTSAVIIAFGKDANGRWEQLITAGGGTAATIATNPTTDPRSNAATRIAKAPYASSFLRGGCKTVRFATLTALDAGAGKLSAVLLAKPVA
jgi:hypothetical protein